ncbi:carbohydrate kinase family protein [Leekyejoonella antrihumi]|uniref:Carbohydrate kinase n=1 Tax=Leekyejoonella antrihumi TaxID=1660198 RepID=A0A563E5D0_9MICO|nr:carbohydrate kinase [Leekyejoonella antrihumi]TWP37422.1 carbohydrate kinase [Leekyejoonella antrihumi]
MGTARTLVVGESLVDIVHRPGLPPAEHVGGSPLNVAVGLARLGHPVELSTYLARDAHGQAILDHLRVDGVALTTGSTTADHTPTATATLDEDSSATYEFDLMWDLPYRMPTDFDHFHTGSIAAALQPGAERVRDWMLSARAQATTSFDPNVRPTLIGSAADNRAVLEQLIGLADVVKASDEDISWLYGGAAPVDQILPLWARLGPSVVVATRGGNGALVHLTATGETIELPGRTVELVDTVGAGDSFQSGLISGLLDAGLLGGVEARQRLLSADAGAVLPAVQRAIDASAITVSRAGAQPPSRSELA